MKNEKKKNDVINYAASLILGAFFTLAFAPFHWLAMGFISLMGFWLVVTTIERRAVFSSAWCFFIAHFVTSLYWISLSFFVDAPRTGFFAIPAVLLLSCYLGFYGAMACYLWRRFFYGMPILVSISSFSFLWMTFDYLRGTLFTGFPWQSPASVWGDSLVVMQSLSWLGSWGLGWVTLFVFIVPMLYFTRRASSVYILLLPFAFLCSLAWWGSVRLYKEDTFFDDKNIVLIQPNIAQKDKWVIDKAHQQLDDIIALSADAMRSHKETLVIWPEAALSFDFDADSHARIYATSFLSEGSYLILGSLARREGYNRLLVLNQKGEIVASYSKNHLVPFGEYAPLMDSLPFLQKLLPTIASMKSGAHRPDINIGAWHSFIPLICYEVIFSLNENNAQWILNITNDAWFGQSTGPWQHATLARMRAIEEALPVVRVANTGISFVSDRYGRILKQLPLYSSGSITLIHG